jgi:hypothetical protein
LATALAERGRQQREECNQKREGPQRFYIARTPLHARPMQRQAKLTTKSNGATIRLDRNGMRKGGPFLEGAQREFHEETLRPKVEAELEVTSILRRFPQLRCAARMRQAAE